MEGEQGPECKGRETPETGQKGKLRTSQTFNQEREGTRSVSYSIGSGGSGKGRLEGRAGELGGHSCNGERNNDSLT